MEQEEDEMEKVLDVTKRDYEHCKSCKMAVIEPPKIQYAR